MELNEHIKSLKRGIVLLMFVLNVSVVCLSVLDFRAGSFGRVLAGTSDACQAAAALQERVGAVERLVCLFT